ncbi:hypothetical protein [Stenotrophomonas rhizophila]|uniref:hypothetical protein n=1 Tax=Stenotrophomonas rhizophila TaxID=216778 RepID=UPI000A3DAEEA|nr:hypothetical protein [Stenotrophomonas rhizophila]
MRHPHRHRSFAPAMRGQRPALASVLAWLALVAMLLTGLPVLEHAVPGSSDIVLQMPVEERPAGGGETAAQEDAPAKLRRVASARASSTPLPPLPEPVDALGALMATMIVLPPQVSPSVDSAPATPLPSAPGLRVQRGQAPPQG